MCGAGIFAEGSRLTRLDNRSACGRGSPCGADLDHGTHQSVHLGPIDTHLKDCPPPILALSPTRQRRAHITDRGPTAGGGLGGLRQVRDIAIGVPELHALLRIDLGFREFHPMQTTVRITTLPAIATLLSTSRRIPNRYPLHPGGTTIGLAAPGTLPPAVRRRTSMGGRGESEENGEAAGSPQRRVCPRVHDQLLHSLIDAGNLSTTFTLNFRIRDFRKANDVTRLILEYVDTTPGIFVHIHFHFHRAQPIA